MEIAKTDLSAAWGQREWPNFADGQQGFLDILILDEKQQFLCAIENKVWSGEHSRQLTRYRRALEIGYPNYNRHYIFLSPWGTLAQEDAERGHWKAVGYDVVCRVVEETVESSGNSISEEVRAFLRQYAKTLRRHILGGDADIRKLAATVHQRHKAAIDFINATVPGYHREMVGKFLKGAAVENWSTLKWEFDCENPGHIRFLPEAWKEFQSIRSGTGWKVDDSDSLMLFEFKYPNLNLVLTLSPCQHEYEPTKEGIDKCLSQMIHPLNRWTWGEGWILFGIGTDILSQSDFEQWDENAIRSKIENWVEVFTQSQYPEIRDAVVQCLTEFEASKQP